MCYSWWVLSAMCLLRRDGWIDGEALRRFILSCQDEEEGGIADKPGDLPDVFHTFFGERGESIHVVHTLLWRAHTSPHTAPLLRAARQPPSPPLPCAQVSPASRFSAPPPR